MKRIQCDRKCGSGSGFRFGRAGIEDGLEFFACLENGFEAGLDLDHVTGAGIANLAGLKKLTVLNLTNTVVNLTGGGFLGLDVYSTSATATTLGTVAAAAAPARTPEASIPLASATTVGLGTGTDVAANSRHVSRRSR